MRSARCLATSPSRNSSTNLTAGLRSRRGAGAPRSPGPPGCAGRARRRRRRRGPGRASERPGEGEQATAGGEALAHRGGASRERVEVEGRAQEGGLGALGQRGRADVREDGVEVGLGPVEEGVEERRRVGGGDALERYPRRGRGRRRRPRARRRRGRWRPPRAPHRARPSRRRRRRRARRPAPPRRRRRTSRTSPRAGRGARRRRARAPTARGRPSRAPPARGRDQAMASARRRRRSARRADAARGRPRLGDRRRCRVHVVGQRPQLAAARVAVTRPPAVSLSSASAAQPARRARRQPRRREAPPRPGASR